MKPETREKSGKSGEKDAADDSTLSEWADQQKRGMMWSRR